VRLRRAAALVLAGGLLVAVCARERAKDAERDDDHGARASRTDRRIDEQLAPALAPAAREGLAAAILIDVSGSMKGAVAGEDGRHEAKIDIARRAAHDLVDQFARYADEHRDEPVLLGLYEFSQRNGEPDCRPILPMGPPDRAHAESALDAIRPDGGTPIGNAMIAAKRELDATGLTRRHLLVVTDGENTDGFAPDRVAAAIVRRPEAERPSIYFVAFDIEESKFAKVREAGSLVLAAANARELNDTLDGLLRGKILIEK
jgi:Ca-activated chloride channel homolog